MKKYMLFFALFAFVATAGISAPMISNSTIVSMDCDKCGKKKCGEDCKKTADGEKPACCAKKGTDGADASAEKNQKGGAATMGSCGGQKMAAGCCAHSKKASADNKAIAPKEEKKADVQ